MIPGVADSHRFLIPMRGNEMEIARAHALVVKFLIPMRGNETVNTALRPIQTVMFLIPMRGNEWRGPGPSSNRWASAFLIPMRGNEDTYDVETRRATVRVPDPHEG